MIRRSHRQRKLLQLYITSQCGIVRNSSNSRSKPPISQKVKFVDQLRVVAKGGNGGGGASALFGRTGHHPRAAGGNGAPGGTVMLRASKQLTGLGSIPLHIEAARGGSGGKQWMDGKRGADKIVDVPLGTLVYQLLQLKGDADSPHGVTALQPDAAAAASLGVRQWQQHQQQQQQQQQHVQRQLSSVDAEDAADGLAMEQGAFTSQSNTISSGLDTRSSSSSMTRRKLFPQLHELPSGASVPTQQVQCTGSSSTGSSDNSSSTVNSSSKEPWHAHTGSTSSVAAAAAATMVDKHSTTDSNEGETDALYEQLVSCQRQLTNAEKLSLLYAGRLPSPHHGPHDMFGPDSHAAAAGVLESDGLSEDDSDVLNDTDDEPPASDEDDWIVLPPAEGDSAAAAAAGGGHYGDGLERRFSKQQVWSILESQAVLLGELTQDGQSLIVAAGGKGGRGNAVSASKPHGPASRARTDGQPGHEVMLLLKLKLLADVVLVGLSNVGKSSLIAALTHARAQVGSYAFTTLRPQLGMLTDTEPVIADRYSGSRDQPTSSIATAMQSTAVAAAEAAAAEAIGSAGTTQANSEGSSLSSSGAGISKLVLADLPGLVPGAHAGKGRGTAFLAHLQRARCLALVIDMTGGADQVGQQVAAGDNCLQADSGGVEVNEWQGMVPFTPSEQLAILQEELRQFDNSVMQLPMIVVANKVDVMSPEAAAATLESLKAATRLPIVPVSAKQGLGLQRLKSALQLLVGSSSRHSSS